MIVVFDNSMVCYGSGMLWSPFCCATNDTSCLRVSAAELLQATPLIFFSGCRRCQAMRKGFHAKEFLVTTVVFGCVHHHHPNQAQPEASKALPKVLLPCVGATSCHTSSLKSMLLAIRPLRDQHCQ